MEAGRTASLVLTTVAETFKEVTPPCFIPQEIFFSAWFPIKQNSHCIVGAEACVPIKQTCELQQSVPTISSRTSEKFCFNHNEMSRRNGT